MKSVNIENGPRVIATALAVWAGSVALAAAEGVFVKLGPDTVAMLALFAAAYALATYYLDRGVQDLARGAGTASLVAATFMADLVIAATVVMLAQAEGAWLANLARFPHALTALFVAPLALPLHVAALARVAARGRVRPAAERSPGANPAAT